MQHSGSSSDLSLGTEKIPGLASFPCVGLSFPLSGSLSPTLDEDDDGTSETINPSVIVAQVVHAPCEPIASTVAVAASSSLTTTSMRTPALASGKTPKPASKRTNSADITTTLHVALSPVVKIAPPVLPVAVPVLGDHAARAHTRQLHKKRGRSNAGPDISAPSLLEVQDSNLGVTELVDAEAVEAATAMSLLMGDRGTQLSEAQRAQVALTRIRDEVKPTGRSFKTLVETLATLNKRVEAVEDPDPVVAAVRRICRACDTTSKYAVRKLTNAMLLHYSNLEGKSRRTVIYNTLQLRRIHSNEVNENAMTVATCMLILHRMIEMYGDTLRIPDLLSSK